MKKIIASLLSLSVVACGGSDGDNTNGGSEKDSLKYLTPPQAGYQTFDRVQGNTRAAYSSNEINQYEHINPDTGVGIPVNPSCKVDEEGANECDIAEPDILRVFDINKKYALVQIDNATIDYEDKKYVGRYSFIQDKLTGELYPMLRGGKLQTLWLSDEFVSVNSSNQVAYDSAIYFYGRGLEGDEAGYRNYIGRYRLDADSGVFVFDRVHDVSQGEQIYAFAVDEKNNIVVHEGQTSEVTTSYLTYIWANGQSEDVILGSDYPIILNNQIVSHDPYADTDSYFRFEFNENSVELTELALNPDNDIDLVSFFGGISRDNYYVDYNCKAFDTKQDEFKLVRDDGWWENGYYNNLNVVATQDYLICLNVWLDGKPTEGVFIDAKDGSSQHFFMDFYHGHWDDGFGIAGVVATQHNEFKIVQEYRPVGAQESQFKEFYYNVDTNEEYVVGLVGERMSLKVFSYLEETTD
ncbi:hypothetical protein AB4501_07375 [Vibrio sp. 10N.222.55.E8]